MAIYKRSINGCTKPMLFYFDAFELNIASGELRLGEAHLNLQPQPFKVLALLVSKPGQIVTREEIRRQVWNTGIFVDFDRGLNFCVRQIRRVLGEEARSPRFIETIHRRGYRFIAQVNAICHDDPTHASTAVSGTVYINNNGKPMTLAVLPFHDLSCTHNQDILADGITELLVTYLSTNGLVRVISRTTTMQYKDGAKSLTRIGQELGADRVLEGAVLRSGMGVRITARLINSFTDQSEWAACYDMEMDDHLLLQEHVAYTVASDTVLYLSSKLKQKNVWTPKNVPALEGSLKNPGRVWPTSPGGFPSSHASAVPITLRGRLT